MKTLTTLALSVALSTGAFSLQAAEQADQDVAICKAELQARYGQDTELNLVERRRNQHGTRMRVAARLDADNSYFATCWVARDDISGFEGGDEGNMFAVTSHEGASE
jgi:phosphotransacetylase